MQLPQARRDDLLTTRLDDEVVVYDPARKQAHSLNRLAVAVWNHADDVTTIEHLQRKVSDEVGSPIDEAAILSALRKLERAHLLSQKLGTSTPMTRREALRKAGRYGAAAVVATPIIASALVPVAAAAASVCVGSSPGSTAGATCGATCQCLTTMTHTGPGTPACVDVTANAFASCGSPLPGGAFVPCALGTVCIESDGSPSAGICYPTCPTPTCTC